MIDLSLEYPFVACVSNILEQSYTLPSPKIKDTGWTDMNYITCKFRVGDTTYVRAFFTLV